MKRPTFFISSTIHDFHDLRSALKFYLEEQGCNVLASEFNDFTKPLDEHSYDACISSIQSADYFILLIGSRVGGWFDENARISITQREYQEAYKLQCAGKLKVINFVRASVWQVREDRHELTNYLKSQSIDNTLQKSIANYPSKFASDAEFLSNFITEVSRSHETKLSVKGEQSAPTGNWVHVFSGFKDIIDVLQGQLFSSTPVEELTLKRLLRRELRDIVSKCLVKDRDGRVYSPMYFIDKHHKEYPIVNERKFDEFTSIPVQQWNGLSFLVVQIFSVQFHPVVLTQAIALPTFLEFDFTTNSYKETDFYEALLLLQDQIRRFNRSNTSDTVTVTYKYSSKDQPNKTSFNIETNKLIPFLYLLDRWANVIELSKALLVHLEGSEFKMPYLRSESPIQGMQERLDAGRPTDAEIDKYLYKANEPLK
jgi:hypothetical protein